MLECKSIKSENNCIKLCILCTLSVLILWRDVRVVEGARLERVYRGNSIVGSNPTFSAIAVLDGESAVPCNLQSAIAGLNSSPRL